MAIRLRRGLSTDYDATKMVTGEAAIFTDTDEMVFKGTNSVKLLGENSKQRIFQGYANINNGASAAITIPNSFRGEIFLHRAAAEQGMLMVTCSSTGGVYVTTILGVTGVTVTAATNTLTIANASGSTVYVFYIGNNALT